MQYNGIYASSFAFIESFFSHITNKICNSNDLRYTLCYVAVLYYYICKKQVEGYRGEYETVNSIRQSTKRDAYRFYDQSLMPGNQTFFQGNITDITDFVKAKRKKSRSRKTANGF